MHGDHECICGELQTHSSIQTCCRGRVECGAQGGHQGVRAELACRVGSRSQWAAPPSECQEHRLEVPAARGQLIDQAGSRWQRTASGEHARVLEVAQALGEDVLARSRQSPVQVGEPLRPEQQLTHDQERPPFADDVQGAGDATQVSIATQRPVYFPIDTDHS